MKRLFIFYLLSLSLHIIDAQNINRSNFTDDLIKQMSIEEKVTLLVGADSQEDSKGAIIGFTDTIVPGAAGTTVGISRLNIPAIVMADGPAGLRISPKRENSKASFYCTHFPVATMLASTWNTDLINQVGSDIGNEALEYGVDVILSPGVNIMRNPLCGRNFEYFSEDPLLTGIMASSMIKGIESNNVGSSVKHFAVNNQEINRTSIDIHLSPRALREIYLKAFEIIIKKANPWSIMTSYNKINGTYASQRADLITSILRDEWKYDGLVVSDWNGGIDAVEQIRAGNDLLMPGTRSQHEQLLSTIQNGTLSLRDVDTCVSRVLKLIKKTPRYNNYIFSNKPNLNAHAKTALEAAKEGIVLIENKNKSLPLSLNIKNIALFGVSSYNLIVGGSGSGDVNHAYAVSLIDGLKKIGLRTSSTLYKTYEKHIINETSKLKKTVWYMPKEQIPELHLEISEIYELAKNQDAAIITIGKSSGEFVDRKLNGNYTLTNEEQYLIKNVCEAFHANNKKVIVILNICGVIETASWINQADAVVISWLAGQEGGNAIADILAGKTNPSGKLPMTFPLSYSDVSSSSNFANADILSDEDIEKLKNSLDEHSGDNSLNRKDIDYSNYEEDIFVGYRHFCSKNIKVAYPFGYGLSYTNFTIDKMSINKNKEFVIVNCEIKNVGKIAGKEVLQLYVSAPGLDMPKPSMELKAFAKTKLLAPGETESISLSININDLSSFSENESAWVVESGLYKFMIATSSLDIKQYKNINIEGKIVEKVLPLLQNKASK